MRTQQYFKNWPAGLKNRSSGCVAALLMTLSCGSAIADDTEIFFGASKADPNVLLLLDVSSSMKQKDGTPDTRLQRLKDALYELLATTTGINIGLATYRNAGGTKIEFLHDVQSVADPAHNSGLLNSIQGLEPKGGTPTVTALNAGRRYYYGEIAGSTTPVATECQSNHIVLLTDGIPTSNDDQIAEATRIKNTIGGGCDLPIGAEGGECGAELTRYMANNDFDGPSGAIPGLTNIVTHTIGFELSGPESIWLEGLSTASHVDGETNPSGTHHNANSTQSLIDAFNAIAEVAKGGANTFVAPAITLDRFSGLSHRNDVYLALFTPSSSANWEGNLKRYDFSSGVRDLPVLVDENNNEAINPATGTFYASSSSWWSDGIEDGSTVSIGGAIHNLDANNRRVYTNVVSDNLTASDNLVHENSDDITAQMLGVTAAERDNLLKWARGVDVDDYDDDPSTTTRKQMGDALHSQPTVVTYGRNGGTTDSVVYVGTNQGYLHAFDTNTGEEVFSFIPEELLGNLNTFYQDKNRTSKLYGLDGTLSTWIKDENQIGTIDGDDHVYLYAGMRRGGNNYYALDVTNKNEPKLLWDTVNNPDFDEMGQSWSKPTPGKIKHKGEVIEVLIFGGGYAQGQDFSTFRSPDSVGTALFIVDAETGQPVWKANSVDFTNMDYSMPSDPSVIDINGDGLTDQIYIGDMGGQVWRFDIDNPIGNGDVDATGGVIARLAGNASNDFRKFFYSPDISLNKGAPDYLSVSIGSGNRANPLSKNVDNSFYMIKQFSINNAPDGYGMEDPLGSGRYRPVEVGDLYDATNNDLENSNPTIAGDALDEFNEAQGWQVRLTAPGEKVLSRSLTVSGGLNFTTYIPQDEDPLDPCAPSVGSSRFYKMHVSNAAPTNGNSPNDRYQDNPGSGIASSANLFFTEEGVFVQEGNRIVDSTNLDRLRRTYWSEQTQ